MVSELNHLALCLRLHVLTITMSVFKGSPSPFQLSYKAADIHICCIYTSRFIFRFPISRLSFYSDFFNLIGAPCESSALHSACYPQGQMRDGTRRTEERKLCAEKAPYWKEALEIKWLNYVPVGWCSRYIRRREKIEPCPTSALLGPD